MTGNTDQEARGESVGWPQVGGGAACVVTLTGNTCQGARCGSVWCPQAGDGASWMRSLAGNTGMGPRCGSVWWPQVGKGAAWMMTVTTGCCKSNDHTCNEDFFQQVNSQELMHMPFKYVWYNT